MAITKKRIGPLKVFVYVLIVYLVVSFTVGTLLSFTQTFSTPFARQFLIVVFLLLTIPTILVSALRHFAINSNIRLRWKLLALFFIWMIFLLMFGASLSVVVSAQTQIIQTTYTHYYTFFVAVLVAISFWLIENASKATVEIFKTSTLIIE